MTMTGRSGHTGSITSFGRFGIDDVRPQVSGRTLPSKAVVGEVVPVSALVWREGHDAVAATLELTSPSGEQYSILMQQEVYRPDYVHAVFVPDVDRKSVV